jgi:hypothetical protein
LVFVLLGRLALRVLRVLRVFKVIKVFRVFLGLPVLKVPRELLGQLVLLGLLVRRELVRQLRLLM